MTHQENSSGKRPCAQCGQEFEPTNGKNRYCPACKKRDHHKEESCPKAVLPKRACHDCGRPTTDYRCPQCQYKWAKKHGVVLDDVGCHARVAG